MPGASDSVPGFHDRFKKPLSACSQDDARRTGMIRQVWTDSGKIHGSASSPAVCAPSRQVRNPKDATMPRLETNLDWQPNAVLNGGLPIARRRLLSRKNRTDATATCQMVEIVFKVLFHRSRTAWVPEWTGTPAGMTVAGCGPPARPRECGTITLCFQTSLRDGTEWRWAQSRANRSLA